MGGCTVGPKYQRATVPVPAKWDVSEPWRESAPKDDLAKGEWWSIFHDDDLNVMEKTGARRKSNYQNRGRTAGAGARLRRSPDFDAIPFSFDLSQCPTPAAFRRQARQ